MRKLASIQRIQALTPIENADKIETAKVINWEVVVQKGQFKVGDLCVYIEIDSLLPEKPEFEFMRSKKFRVKTIKLRGQVSQGICFTLSDLALEGFNEDDDVTNLLGIKKYEPNPDNVRNKKTEWPKFLRKTDETRIQNIPDSIINQIHRFSYYITEKLDGSSMTVYYKDGEFGVCSRNIKLMSKGTKWYHKFLWWKKWFDADNKFTQTAKRLGLDKKLRENLAIQGELIGPGIQGNKYGLKDYEFRVFNIYDINKGKYMDFIPFGKICSKYGLKTVPILNRYFFQPFDAKQMIEMSKGQSLLAPVPREGIVVRTRQEREIFRLGRCSFKAINPDFLLRHKE